MKNQSLAARISSAIRQILLDVLYEQRQILRETSLEKTQPKIPCHHRGRPKSPVLAKHPSFVKRGAIYASYLSAGECTFCLRQYEKGYSYRQVETIANIRSTSGRGAKRAIVRALCLPIGASSKQIADAMAARGMQKRLPPLSYRSMIRRES